MIFKKIISGLASDKNRVATRKGSGEVYHRQIKVFSQYLAFTLKEHYI